MSWFLLLWILVWFFWFFLSNCNSLYLCRFYLAAFLGLSVFNALCIFNRYFYLNFNIFKHSLKDSSLFNNWFFRQEKLKSLRIIDAKEVWCAEWISKYLKRFVLIASFFVVGVSHDRDKLDQFEIPFILHAVSKLRYN